MAEFLFNCVFCRAVEEALKLAIISNEHIVKNLGITRWKSHFGIIMEEIKGGNLEDLLFSAEIENLPWALRFRMCFQIVTALRYLHSKNCDDHISKKPYIQHGDLKPQNILLTESANVKLGDFSAAVVAQATNIANSSSCSFPATTQYTPFYTAPEILNKQKCCIKSDIYR